MAEQSASEDEDYYEDMVVAQLIGSMRQHGEMSRSQLPRRRKPKRAEMTSRQRKWLNFKDNAVEKVVKDLFNDEKKKMTVLQTPANVIRYAEDPASANQMAEDLLDNMDKDGDEYFEFGTDTEGNGATLQLYTVANEITHAYLLHLKKILVNGRLPTKVFQLMNDPRVIFIGKNIEKEMREFFDEYGFGSERRANILFIDTLSLIQTCDLLSRENPDGASAFAANGTFRVDRNVDEDVYADVLKDASLRAAVNYFLHQSIDKCVEHVHPNKTDWTLEKEDHPTRKTMSKKMKQYAVTDAEAGYRCAKEAAMRLSLSPIDFARKIRIRLKG